MYYNRGVVHATTHTIFFRSLNIRLSERESPSEAVDSLSLFFRMPLARQHAAKGQDRESAPEEPNTR
jgi:hypothetical protein